MLFIDARNIFRQIDRAHRDWLPERIEFLANIARLYRGEPVEAREGSAVLMDQSFPEGRYVDVPGLCAVVTLDAIEEQGWSLNPGRYVGVAAAKDDGVDFRTRLADLTKELEKLTLRLHRSRTESPPIWQSKGALLNHAESPAASRASW